MDADLKHKKLAADAALSRSQPEDREAVLDYVAALELYEAQYQVLRRSIEELTRQLIAGQFLGPRLVERRGDGQGERRGPARGNLPLGVVPELHDPRELRASERIEVDVEREPLADGQAVQVVDVGGGCGVEEFAGHGPSEDI